MILTGLIISNERISAVVVLVGVDVGEDPAQGAEDCVDGGRAGQLRVGRGGDVVLDRVGVAHVVDNIGERVD